MESVSGNTFDSINPANSVEIVGRFQASVEEDVIRAIESAEQCLSNLAIYFSEQASRNHV